MNETDVDITEHEELKADEELRADEGLRAQQSAEADEPVAQADEQVDEQADEQAYEHQVDQGVEPLDAAADEPPAPEPPTPETSDSSTTGTTASSAEPLLTSESTDSFLSRWSEVQAGFIEDPHQSVADADALLAEVVTAYQQALEQRRAQISAGRSDGTADTEDLRLALLEYRELISAICPVGSA